MNKKFYSANIKHDFVKIRLTVILSVVVMILFLLGGGAFAQSPFRKNNLAVLVAAASANNTTVSVIEIDKTTVGQSAIQIINLPGTGTDAIRVSGSATSTLYAANSNDGSLFCFTGANDGSASTTVNTNTLTNRAVITINSLGAYSIATTYTGTSGNQTRCATTINNTDYYIADQGGVFTNVATTASPVANIRSIKSFGGIVYLSQSSTATSSIQVSTVSATTGGTITGLNGLTNLSTLTDFYLISSGSNGSSYDILYVVRNTSPTVGAIDKYSLVNGNWTANGSCTTDFGGFGLAAEYYNSGALLYISSGNGATTANSVKRLTDAAGYNQTINIADNTLLYTSATGTIIKGIAFAPKDITATNPNIPTSKTSINSNGKTIFVEGLSSTATIVITDITGKRLASKRINTTDMYCLDMNGLHGIYLVHIVTEKGATTSKVILK